MLHDVKRNRLQSSDIVFDLALLQSSCPNLTALDIISMTLCIDREPTGQFRYLKKVIMESPSSEIISWFLQIGCPMLEEFKVRIAFQKYAFRCISEKK